MVQWSNPTMMYQSVSAVHLSITPSGYELHIFCIKAEIEIQILSDVLSLAPCNGWAVPMSCPHDD